MPDFALKNLSLDALFDLALGSDEESDEYWRAVTELWRRGDRATFERACSLTQEAAEPARIVGVDVLAQLGEGRPFRSEAVPLLESLASPKESAALVDAAITALSHHGERSSEPVVLAHVEHPDADVRFAVAFALPDVCEDPPTRSVVDALFALMEDEDAHVRDWATFGLGTRLDVDTPEIRDALFARIDDEGEDGDVGGEALRGLAVRKDPRAIAPLLEWLAMRDPDPGDLVIDAAEELADPACLPALYALRADWEEGRWSGPLDDAIEACERSAQRN